MYCTARLHTTSSSSATRTCSRHKSSIEVPGLAQHPHHGKLDSSYRSHQTPTMVSWSPVPGLTIVKVGFVFQISPDPLTTVSWFEYQTSQW